MFRKLMLAIPLTAYLTTWYFSLKLFLFPLIQLYGVWNFLGIWILLFISGFVSSATFFYLQSRLPKPQARYKENV